MSTVTGTSVLVSAPSGLHETRQGTSTLTSFPATIVAMGIPVTFPGAFFVDEFFVDFLQEADHQSGIGE